jgi:hypothetical protein
MAAKKAPTKKTASSNTKSSSAAAKRMADEKSTRMGKRTDKAGSSGMGMTKSGVKALAKDARRESLYESSATGTASRDKYTGRIKSMAIQGFRDSSDKLGKKAEKKAKVAEAAVYKKYGVKPKKK